MTVRKPQPLRPRYTALIAALDKFDAAIQAGSAGPVPPGTVAPTNYARAELATALRRLVCKRNRENIKAAKAALLAWDS